MHELDAMIVGVGHSEVDVAIAPLIDFVRRLDTFGLEVNIQTNTNEDKMALELLKSLGFPFSKD